MWRKTARPSQPPCWRAPCSALRVGAIPADGGTLFLDEVNSMDLSLQAKILKAIEEKRFRPVGGEQDVHSDVRIVSAMNVDPITAVREGLLRRDLFYRLGVV